MQPSYRELRSHLLKLAAELERRSEGRKWIIGIGDVCDCGGGRKQMELAIEMATDLDSEAEESEHMLATMANDIKGDMFLF